MKKLIFLIIMSFANPAYSQVSYIEEARRLGSLAGQGKACNASRIDTFEMLAKAIILTKAPSIKSTDLALGAYVAEKIKSHKLAASSCPEVLAVFDNQKIFDIVLYKDGTLTMPDGTTIKPKIAYDATILQSK